MNPDKFEFFHEATIRLCSHLDIREALRDCCEYIGRYVPVIRTYLEVLDPNLTLLRMVSFILEDGQAVPPPPVVNIGGEQKKKWMQNWDGYVIMSEGTEPWFWDHLKSLGRDTNISLLLLLVKVGESYCIWALVAKGRGAYTHEHARLMLLLKKPLTVAIANALRHEEVLRLKNLLADEKTRLQGQMRALSDDIIGIQGGLKPSIELCRQVACLDTPVLLLGETGVGKDLLAQVIHNLSPRKNGPFVSVNCGAMAESLLDSELFGHEKGAFTGAVSSKIGRFDRAHGGTIFLDEIGELSLQGQVRLLRVLQYKEIERVGGTKPLSINTRIIAATNRNLEDMVQSGQFRKDLLFRLNIFPIKVPPLRERREDIPELLFYFIERKKRELKLNVSPRINQDDVDKLKIYHWPGNVRELVNVVERALITNRDGLLMLEELLTIQPTTSSLIPTETRIVEDTKDQLIDVTSAHIKNVLKQANGKINGPGGAAERLGLHPNTLRKKMDKLGISYKRKR